MGAQEREKLQTKLEELLPELNEEGLAFLLRQATVLKHNAEVEALEKELSELEPSPEPKAPAGGAPKKRGVEIEQTGPDSFVIQVGRERVFFAREELRRLAKIVHAAEDKLTGQRRLHNWFSKERRDFLNDTGIGKPTDPVLAQLFDLIMSRYRPKS
jgi:hypothetical protein